MSNSAIQHRAGQLFLDLIDLSPADRTRYLNRVCGDDDALREQVTALLEADTLADDLEADWMWQVQSMAHETILQSEPRSPTQNAAPDVQQLGRYRVVRLVGEGSFGTVFQARDEELNRDVAIKIPHRSPANTAEDATGFLMEARTVANLDHPNIVPVFDVGSTEEYPYFIVSKFVAGESLDTFASRSHLSHDGISKIVATIARALEYAHRQGLVHRDVKPGNILIDEAECPRLIDFGLATNAGGLDSANHVAGTPLYLSPEQLTAAHNRVDRRSDIFSLGVILYELLVGERPFSAPNTAQLLDDIQNKQLKSLRSVDESIPAELERICLKALQKQPEERFQTAEQFARDLERLREVRPDEAGPDTVTTTIRSKGLQAFDAGDCGFYPELLPGPRKNGLPESIAFWTERIGKRKTDNRGNPSVTFSVGAIYGPSGCGKSSLVNAGILPHLPKSVRSIYVDCNHGQVEERVLHRLRRIEPGIHGSELSDVFSSLVKTPAIQTERPVSFLIVLDHFEQWLASDSSKQSDLATALSLVDGHQVQVIVLVRDEYWLRLRRFFDRINVPLIDGDNCRLVDLFTTAHAKSLLKEFGEQAGCLAIEEQKAPDEEQILNELVGEISDKDGYVAAIRLSMLFEMIRDKQWDTRALKRLGGLTQIGTTFLDSIFAYSSAPVRRRRHLRACVDVLDVLLSTTTGLLKGEGCTEDRLLAASGYTRANDFYSLLDILTVETRLITEVSAADVANLESLPFETDEEVPVRRFQLTHDYLVPAIRIWVDTKRGQTVSGRAQRSLTERTKQWSLHREDRYLPNPLEYVSIQTFTRHRSWSEANHRMLSAANRFYGVRIACFAAVAMLVGLFAFWTVQRNRQSQANALLGAVSRAPEEQWPLLAETLSPLREPAQVALANEPQLLPKNQRKQWLLDLWSGDVARVCDLLKSATDEQFPLVLSELMTQPSEAMLELNRRLTVFKMPYADKELRTVANLVLANLALGENDAWSYFASEKDPRLQSHLIHGFATRGMAPSLLLDRLAVEDDTDLLFGLIATLRECPLKQLDWADRNAARRRLVTLLQEHEDAGIHAVCASVLRKWEFREDLVNVATNPSFQVVDPKRSWYYNSLGICMNIVEVPAANGENEPSHRYAISATEITRGQLKSLLPNETLAGNLGNASDLPVAGITTFAALQFCKRLTAVQMQDDARHRLTQAVQTESSNSFRIDTRQNGIRLPTVDEWRIACEAGMNGDCFFGDLQFVDRYAWRTLDSFLQPVGTLLPNRFGLFDTYGNVREWAIGPADNTGPVEQHDKEQGEQQDKGEGKQQVPIVLAPNSRVFIVGSARNTPLELVATTEASPSIPRAGAGFGVGFRIAQTLPSKNDGHTRKNVRDN